MTRPRGSGPYCRPLFLPPDGALTFLFGSEANESLRTVRSRLFPEKNSADWAADLIIRPDMNRYEAEHAYDLDPWHPLVHLALAGFEKDPVRADFLRQYSLDRLPNDPKLRQRAAEFLRKQGKEDLARLVEGQD